MLTSTTYDKSKKVDLGGDANVKPIIEHKTDKKIERLSQNSGEKEVLLPSNTKHVVKSFKEKKKDGMSYIEIELLEITE